MSFHTSKHCCHTFTMFVMLLATAASGLRPANAQTALSQTQRPEMINAETERAIQNGLAFLARKQAKDGGWDEQRYPTAMTSLAALALLAGGNTPYEGKYAQNIRRATENLLKVAKMNDDGLFAEPRERGHCMHGHGFAMLFLGEVYGMDENETRQREIRRALTAAIKLTVRSQSDAGGWLYTPTKSSDEGSVTVAQVQGLRACYNAGIKVPREVIDNSGKYLEFCSNPDGGICYSARSRGASRPAITAAAVATMYHAGKYDHPVAHKALKYLDNTFSEKNYVVRDGDNKYYTTYYMSQAMYLSSEARWNKYFPAVRDDLVRTQQTSSGSWHGPYGEVYGTAMALLALQLPYANLPIFQR